MFILFHEYANLADSRNILVSRLKLGTLMLLFGVIISLRLDGQTMFVTQTTEAYNGGDFGSVYDKSSLSDATFDTTIEKLGCTKNYNDGIESQYKAVSASLSNSIVNLDDGIFHIKQDASTCENEDDDSNAHYEDVLKEIKKERK